MVATMYSFKRPRVFFCFLPTFVTDLMLKNLLQRCVQDLNQNSEHKCNLNCWFQALSNCPYQGRLPVFNLAYAFFWFRAFVKCQSMSHVLMACQLSALVELRVGEGGRGAQLDNS